MAIPLVIKKAFVKPIKVKIYTKVGDIYKLIYTKSIDEFGKTFNFDGKEYIIDLNKAFWEKNKLVLIYNRDTTLPLNVYNINVEKDAELLKTVLDRKVARMLFPKGDMIMAGVAIAGVIIGAIGIIVGLKFYGDTTTLQQQLGVLQYQLNQSYAFIQQYILNSTNTLPSDGGIIIPR